MTQCDASTNEMTENITCQRHAHMRTLKQPHSHTSTRYLYVFDQLLLLLKALVVALQLLVGLNQPLMLSTVNLNVLVRKGGVIGLGVWRLGV